MEKEMQGLILDNPDYIRNIGNLKRAILSSEVTLQRSFWTGLEKAMEAAGHPVIRDETYRYALDDKKNRIEGYYKGMADNRRYGLEFSRRHLLQRGDTVCHTNGRALDMWVLCHRRERD